ncbi:hypothetical protein PVAG01_04971 [Phlyctema vagabunda]|uniref:Uncharacterized protein n=1 Tax=Phlyctema vagabunda TaxID=108571 RepID=A0ABR4PIV7_9HELO
METVTNITNAASKAIWGEPAKDTTNEEPVSGTKGNVTAGEPYDAGNLDSTSTDKTTGLSRTTPSSTNAASGPIDETGKTGVTLAPGSTTGIAADKPTDSGEPSTGAKFSIGDNTTEAPRLVHDGNGSSESTGLPPTSVTGSKTEEKDTFRSDTGKTDATHKPLGDTTNTTTTTGAGLTDRTKESSTTSGPALTDRPKDSVNTGTPETSDAKPSTTSSHAKSSSPSKDADSSKDGKPSLKDKIKDKLHIHKH